MKINILLCDDFPGLLPPSIPSYESMFMRLFDAACAGTRYRVFRVMDGELPDVPATAAAPGEVNLITGCNLGAYDDVPWIKRLLSWIAEAHAARAKIVGVCFGHQAIAQALGGNVEKSAKGWGTGLRESVLTAPDALRFFPDGKMRLLYNHHDQVTRLPEGAFATATSEFCPIEGFRVGTHILTFQGHPEYVPEYAEHLIRDVAANEPESVKRAALASLRAGTPHQGANAAAWIQALGEA